MSRRLLAVASAALAGGLVLAGLTACRDEPTVAAYVEDAQLTNAQVEKIVQEFPADLQQRVGGQIRQAVVSAFVVREVGQRITAEHGGSVPAPDLSQYQDEAAQLKIPATGGFVQIQAAAEAAMRAIQPLGTPQQLTDVDQHEVYAAVQAALREKGEEIRPFDQVKNLLDSPDLRAALAVRPLLRDALKKYAVVVNPRYQPVGIPVPFTIAQVQTEVVVPLNAGGPPAVVDVSSPQA